MAVTVILPSGGRKLVAVLDNPTLTVDPEGCLDVTYLSEEYATVTAGCFKRGEWREAWYQPSATAEREQHIAAPD